MSLKEYSRKRDFSKTSEPRGKRTGGNGRGRGQNRFVVQKHAASHLHYDFRLEAGGTLKSWAVPKGIPLGAGERRLAVEVEDHPVSYIDFEGTIPKGEYGGGTVMVWDFGNYTLLDDKTDHDFAEGRLHFSLSGKKLKGEWHLVRMRGGKQWLLIRGHEAMRAISPKQDDTSALSGRTMRQIAMGGRTWHAHPMKDAAPAKGRARDKVAPDSRRDVPKFVEPMKARLVESLPEGGWIYEVKLDGFRTLALKNGGNICLLSRNQKDFGPRFPEIVAAVAGLPARDAVIDGEIVALDSRGRSDFQLLQAYELGTERPPIFLYAFDLLELESRDLKREPLGRRKELLAKLLRKAGGALRYSASLKGSPKRLLAEAGKLGLEGLVGKRRESTYEAGRRSGEWVKLKLHHEQEMVIGGYTDPAGSREHFGALLVGYHEGRTLRFAGKVGTGFDEASLARLYRLFRGITQAECPFDLVPERGRGGGGSGLTKAEMKRCHWLKPKLVGQIRFSEWTRDGKLRQPVFLGLREDKAAAEVVRERVAVLPFIA